MPIPPNHSRAQDKALILGIESSCDETAASVLRLANDGKVEILSSIIASQDAEHAPFGGVVPEIAARAHMQKIDSIIDQAVQNANIPYTDLSAIAATAGPGLIGGVIAAPLGAVAARHFSPKLMLVMVGVTLSATSAYGIYASLD